MKKVGIRELKQRTSEIVRRVREEGEIVEVTFRGSVVARIVPAVDSEQIYGESLSVLDEMHELTSRIAAEWPSEVSALDAVREQRR